MKYLFYDCECANSFDKISKICSLGYCLCDTSFNLIRKEDVIINPEAPFDYHLYDKKSDIKLNYPKSVFYSAPNFKQRYNFINDLFTSDVVVFGFSLDNDIKFILDDIERYKLQVFNFKYLDVQTVYRIYSNDSLNTSLDKAMLGLGINLSDNILHKSDDDAYMTMLVLKQIMENLGVNTLIDLLHKLNMNLSSVSEFIKKKDERRIKKEQKLKIYLEKRERLKNLLPLYGKLSDEPKSDKYKGMTFSFSKQVIQFVDKAIKAQKIIYDNAGITVKDNLDTIVIVGYKENLNEFKENNIKYIEIDEILR